MKQMLHACVVVLGIVNVVLFAIWISIIRVTAVSGATLGATYKFDQISFQISVLEATFVILSLLLVVMGFFGYQHIVERAEMQADKTARATVTQLHKGGKLRSAGGTSIPPSPLPTAENVPSDDSVAEDL
jgi:hypothetical protein